MIFSVLVFTALAQDWRTADRSSAGIAPSPEAEPQAVVQIYGARAFKWRGYFGIHPWISTKEKDAKAYTVYQVIGWRARSGLSVVSMEEDIPDRRWFGAEPEVLYDIRGEKAEFIIEKIKEVAPTYPYPDLYRVWPGPNSNTFVSFVIRNIPEIGMELPPTAIGKDWINKAQLVGLSESGTGVQVSALGVLGATVGLNEGVEVNILGLTFGIDLLRPAIKLPFIGRIGVKDKPVLDP
jgi:hypothetical protein